MQKKIIAAAVAGLLAAPAFAQTAVTIYGNVDQSIEFVNLGDGAKGRVTGDGYQTQRLGFKINEALANGMSANVVLEMGVGADTGVAGGGTSTAATPIMQLFNRTATVGLSGKFGSVNLGRQYTPSFNAMASGDLWGFAGISSTADFWGGTTRANNSVRYDSPNFNGFTFAGLYGFGDTGATTSWAESVGGQTGVGMNRNNGRHAGLNIGYANGPAAIMYGWGNNDAANATTLVGTATVKTKVNVLSGSYDFGVLKLIGSYSSYKNDPNPATVDNQIWSLGVGVPLAGGTVRVQFAKLDDKLVANQDSSLGSIGYVYPLSKRTTLYGAWAKMKNDNGAARSFAASGGGAIVGTGASAADGNFDPSSLQVGINHAF